MTPKAYSSRVPTQPDPPDPPGCRTGPSDRVRAARSGPKRREGIPARSARNPGRLARPEPDPEISAEGRHSCRSSQPVTESACPVRTPGRTVAASGRRRPLRHTASALEEGADQPRAHIAAAHCRCSPRGGCLFVRDPGWPEMAQPAGLGSRHSQATLHHAAWKTSICLTVAPFCSLLKPALIPSKPILRSISRSTGSRP